MTDFQKIWNETMGCGACEQQPSEDCISREAVDKLSRDLVHVTRDKADFLCNFWEGLNALPSVTPQRPKGKWVYKEYDDRTGIGESFFCSECGEPRCMKLVKYCPNCGAYMKEDAE